VLFTEAISEGHAFNDRRAIIGTQLKLGFWYQTDRSPGGWEHTHQGYNVIKKVGMTDGHAKPHRMVDVHDVDVEMIWRPPGLVSDGRGRRKTHNTTAGNE